MHTSLAPLLKIQAPTRAPAGVLKIDGREIAVAQDHLLEPFARVLEALDRLVSLPACGQGDAERRLIESVYGAIYRFLKALLPSAGHEAIDGLAYSLSLLLIGEAIEANKTVAALTADKAAP